MVIKLGSMRERPVSCSVHLCSIWSNFRSLYCVLTKVGGIHTQSDNIKNMLTTVYRAIKCLFLFFALKNNTWIMSWVINVASILFECLCINNEVFLWLIIFDLNSGSIKSVVGLLKYKKIVSCCRQFLRWRNYSQKGWSVIKMLFRHWFRK